uniref:hypothetical protein n=1 Tax=Sodalis glossinidius TaxID=63612 RepID=UPI0015E846F6|nr:hypothetical protein [Sodalis glossinidius]
MPVKCSTTTNSPDLYRGVRTPTPEKKIRGAGILLLYERFVNDKSNYVKGKWINLAEPYATAV